MKDYLGPESAKKPSNGKPAETVDEMAEKILTALAKSHHFFADLLALFPKADYRTIATALGQLHQDGKVDQDGEGKYQVRGEAANSR